jgi:hypothetical protein
MASEAARSCDTWDWIPVARPAHSRLHYLEPVGRATAAVESLTGYISRLAETHGVAIRTLMLHELMPLLGRDRLTRSVNGNLSSFWSKDARSLNGTGHLAQDMVAALQALTLRQDLGGLTLLAWKTVLPTRGLLRRNRVWCPVCYQSGWRAGQVIYEPLLWSLEVVTVCPIHPVYLQSTCPYPDCQRTQPILGPHAQPGHCAHCLRWLGRDPQDLPAATNGVPEEERVWQAWVAQETGTLLATPPDLATEHTLQNICDAVKYGVDLVAQGNANAFARWLQVSPSAISSWRLQRQRPQLEVLLRLCHRLEISLCQVFRQGAQAMCAANVRQSIGPLPPERPKRARRAFAHEQVRLRLEQILNDPTEPPPAMRQVCKQLGYEHAVIYTYFPELCRAISARYLAYQKERGQQRLQQLCKEVCQKVLIVHQQGKYPSAYRVEALLGIPGLLLHPDARRVWHATLRELGWES